MSQYKPKYPVVEVGIWCTSNAEQNGLVHLEEGDIVTVREPWFAISDIESMLVIWIRLQGWEESVFYRLKDSIYSSSVVDPLGMVDVNDKTVRRLTKRRYCIPLRNLLQHSHGFSESRAKDRLDSYQPILRDCRIAEDVRFYVLEDGPLDPDGLVFDKLTQKYLYG